MDPAGIVANAVGVFVEHPRTHLLQHRQRVGQGDLGGVVDLEAQHARLGVERAVQLDGQRRGRVQPGQDVGVFGRSRCGEVLPVAGREGVGEPVRQGQARALAVRAQHLAGAFVFPALRQPGNTGLQRVGMGERWRGPPGTHDVVDTRQRAVGQGRGELDRAAVELGHQLGAHLDTQLGVVPVTLHEHLDRCETPERVAAREHAGALALLQPQYADGMGAQGVEVDLEQFVTRIPLQDRLQGLRGMAVGHNACALHDLQGALAHTGNVRYRRGVG